MTHRLVGLVVLLASTGILARPAAGAVATGIQIPVIVNLYKNSGVTEQQARDSVAEANKGEARFGRSVVKS